MTCSLRFALLPLLLAALPAQGTQVGGTLTQNTTWSLAGSPYTLTSTVVISNNATLTIDPGVVVQLGSGQRITVGDPPAGPIFGAGTLVARGTPSQPIRFTSTSQTPGDWDALLFNDEAVDAMLDGNGGYLSGSVLANCIVEFGGDNQVYGAVTIRLASPLIHQCAVRDSAAGGVWADMGAGASPTPGLTVRDCEFEGNVLVSIQVSSGANHSISGCSVHHNAHVGISIGDTVDAVVSGNVVFSNVYSAVGSAGAINLGTNTNMQVNDNIVRNNYYVGSNGGGVHVGNGTTTLRRNTIVGNSAARGGGIYVLRNAFVQNVSIYDNTIVGNTASGGGGGIWKDRIATNFPSATFISGNTIAHNHANTHGGGVYFRWGQHFHLTNNRINGNTAGDSGGGVWLGSGGTIYEVTGNVFAANTATNDGGGLHLSGVPTGFAGNPQPINTFLGNSASRGDAIFHAATAALDASSTCWGPNHPSTQPNRIWDQADDPALGPVSTASPVICGPFANLGCGVDGVSGTPNFAGTGSMTTGSQLTLGLTNARANSLAVVVLGGPTYTYIDFLNAVAVPFGAPVSAGLSTDGGGNAALVIPSFPMFPAGLKFYFQMSVLDPSAPNGMAAFSNALLAVSQ